MPISMLLRVVEMGALDQLAKMSKTEEFDLRVKDRTVWLTGAASPRTNQELTTAGWMVRENSQYPVAPSAPAAPPGNPNP